ncbi:MAG: hypothetical protein HY876_02615 [Coriobacteriales bacterium]|nr:hypothetical protein [Coriobacteriales bacterium]
MHRWPARILLTCGLIATFLAAPLLSSSAVAAEPTRWVGFYVDGAPWEPAPFQTVETKTTSQARICNFFQNIETADDNTFTLDQLRRADSLGAIPMVTLEMKDPYDWDRNQSDYTLDKIARGDHDALLRRFARDAKTFNKPVWVRLFHEMNGNWYPWGGTVNSNRPEDFKPAWRHVHDVFAQEGATNIQMVWCVNMDSINADRDLNSSENEIRDYWPGSGYVDYMAIDGYNIGTGTGGKWRTFRELFDDPYAKVSALSTSTPIFVAETGCSTNGGDKPAWIDTMFRAIPKYFPRIVGVSWFHAKQYVNGYTRDWRVTSTPDALAAFRFGSSNGTWSDKRPTSITIRANDYSVRRNVMFSLSGTLTSPWAGDSVRVEVRKPGTSRYVLISTSKPSSSGYWRYSYRPKYRGSYYFRVRYLGSPSLGSSSSRTIRVVVR